MAKEIFYEDLMKHFDDNNLRSKLLELVNEHKIIIIKGFNSAERYMIYRQMFYPLNFEKIIVSEDGKNNTHIRVYNCKIKQKENKTNMKKREETKEIKKEEDYILDESEQSEEENNCSDTDNSYITDEDEQLTKLEDIGSQILEKVSKNEYKIDRIRSNINLVILFNIIGWIIFYIMDPVRLIQIKTTECELSNM